MSERYQSEREAERVVRQNGNTVGDKKIYLKARRMAGHQEGDIPGVTSAGIKMWGAIDYLSSKGYQVLYEVAKEKKDKDGE